MRITDLLDKRSISLNETPKTKRQAERSTTVKHTENKYTQEKKKAPQESEKELPFLMENVMR